jgi:hypothetical protein
LANSYAATAMKTAEFEHRFSLTEKFEAQAWTKAAAARMFQTGRKRIDLEPRRRHWRLPAGPPVPVANQMLIYL